MRRSVIPFVVLAASVTLVGAAARQAPAPPFIVHEWGTFTSVAGADGQAAPWSPLGGPTDLPCFVERNPLQSKGPGTVRMETPVLYFYASQALEASVHVRFPQGYLTEWYPHASVGASAGRTAMSDTIAWPSVRVMPGAPETFPAEPGASHYYAARHTAASPLAAGLQFEKFLFYRGVGFFQPPLTAIVDDHGGVAIRSRSGEPLGDVVLFENRGGAMTFTTHHLAAADAVLPRAPLDDASGAPLTELKRMLVESGLFEPEAQAMIDTWKDSWFEDGARLLYILPRDEVDAILPLDIAPKPAAVARVFVGRIELVTPATIREVKAAIAANDRATLARYGRFLMPIVERAGVAMPAGAWPSFPQSSCR
jgi:hypothetical protein